MTAIIREVAAIAHRKPDIVPVSTIPADNDDLAINLSETALWIDPIGARSTRCGCRLTVMGLFCSMLCDFHDSSVPRYEACSLQNFISKYYICSLIYEYLYQMAHHRISRGSLLLSLTALLQKTVLSLDNAIHKYTKSTVFLLFEPLCRYESNTCFFCFVCLPFS